MKSKILLSAVFLCLLFSCKKNDKKTSGCDKTVASIAGSYSIIKFEIGTNGVFADATSQLEACQLDDKILLNKDGTTVTQDLGTVCSPSDNSAGTWSISSIGQMTINDNNGGPTDISTADITYDCTTLVLTGSDPSAPAEQFRLTLRK